MKKSIRSIVTALLLLTVIPTQMYAGVPSVITPSVTMEAVVNNDALVKRLEEINAMDMSKLTSPEKRQLRKEIRSIQKQMDVGGGVYISVGALILIIILLIILL